MRRWFLTIGICVVSLFIESCDVHPWYDWPLYKVGDYYDVGGKQGVVFEVSSDGRHGKMVSLKGSARTLQWSSSDYGQNRLIGAADEKNGANNMTKVQQISGWRDKYPAFAWCAALGDGWYLPAIEELRAIYRAKDTLNRTLAYEGDELEGGWHWSSTERSSADAWLVDMSDGFAYGIDKSYSFCVRAVSAF